MSESLIYFWEQRSMYMGMLPDIEEHRLASAVLAIGMEDNFRVHNSELGLNIECRSALIPPGYIHETFYNNKMVAVISLEPDSNDYALVRQHMQKEDSGCFFDLADESKMLGVMHDIYQGKPGAMTASHLIDSLIHRDNNVKLVPKPLDKRILKAVEIMKEDPAQTHSLESLAETVYLSSTRFTHLFKDETGVPIRRYRQWLRFRQAVKQISEGETMTVAAMKTGFTDSAHFSRAFRSMFGVKPSALFRKTRPVRTFLS